MIVEVCAWGLEPSLVTGDSWYASLENLKFLRHQERGCLFGIQTNRLVSLEADNYCQVQTFEIPKAGLLVNLKGFGMVKVFRKDFKNEFRYYIIYLNDPEELQAITFDEFKRFHAIHWLIENYHRAIKQVCNIERFQVRDSEAIRTHIYSAIRAFLHLELRRVEELISNWYEVRRNLFTEVIRSFILNQLADAATE